MSRSISYQSRKYFMPAEWARHAGTWLQWPLKSLYPGYELKLERLWLMMVEILSDGEKVFVILKDEIQQDHVLHQLHYHQISEKNIDFYLIPTNDLWARDNGPIFVCDENNEVLITNWTFNGWGERFEYELDNQVPAEIARQIGCVIEDVPLVLEGGAVEVDGKGAFMATRTSIMDHHRNPGNTQKEIEQIVSKYFGVDAFIWLSGSGRGQCEMWGDTTDSHIDLIARFTPQSSIFYNWAENENEPRHEMFSRHRLELEKQISDLSLEYHLVALPEPEGGVYQVTDRVDWRETRYSDAAYSNYYVANDVVLVPVFGNKKDQDALAIIKEHFPKREVIGLDCVGLTEDGGAIHCVTQQQPDGPLRRPDND